MLIFVLVNKTVWCFMIVVIVQVFFSSKVNRTLSWNSHLCARYVHISGWITQDCQTQSGQNCPGLTRERNRLHLQKDVDYLNQYLIKESQWSDLVIFAHHLRKAVREIGFVSGKVSSDRILDVIFADFCIGK